jgi:hypothetical protein
MDSGIGSGWTHVSAWLLFVSRQLPADPPGSRSSDWLAGGAAPGVPSTKMLVAFPHPIASTTLPPTTRSATAPPVDAKPPV